MPVYDPNHTMKQALSAYFERYELPGGGYDAKWFKIKFFGPVVLPLPNIKDRVDAVKIHDLHHILTEYEAKIRGESEIGAWELATGCGKYYAAWILNFGSLTYGIFVWPVRVYKAFMWGSNCKGLYNREYNDELLSKTVAELRAETGTDVYNTSASGKALIHFIIWVLAVLVVLGVGLAVVVVILKWIG
jgi:hypothetical protein